MTVGSTPGRPDRATADGGRRPTTGPARRRPATLPLVAALLAVGTGAWAGSGGVAGAAAAPPARAAPAASCPGATTSVTRSGTTAAAEAVRCLVNVERRAAGLRPLAADERLGRAAHGHAADMGRRDYFSHTSPGGSTFSSRVRARGFDPAAVGENIAAGQTTPRAVVRAWLRSASHCKNVMSRQYTAIGVGVVRAGPAPYSGPTWVQDLGRGRGERAPGGAAVRCPYRPTV